jgi:arsenate reductase
MLEVGDDLRGATPRRLTDDLAREATTLVTMGCGETCPVVPGIEYVDWPLPDPRDLDPASVRHARDEIARRVDAFLPERHLEGRPRN